MKNHDFSKRLFRLFLVLSFTSSTALAASDEELKNQAKTALDQNKPSFDDPVGNSSKSASGSSGAAGAQQGIGAATNLGMSAMMMYMGYEQMETNPVMAGFFFLQAGLGVTQAGMQFVTSSGNNAKSDAFRNGGGSSWNNKYDPKLPTNPDNKSLPPKGNGITDPKNPNKKITQQDNTTKRADIYNVLPPQGKELLSKLEQKGFKVDLATGNITAPNGQTVTPNDFKNPSTLDAKMGFPEGTTAKGNEIVAEIAKRQAELDGNIGGTSIAGAVADAWDAAENVDGSGGAVKGGANKAASALGAANSRLPASALISGLTSKYNGENIGVSADNIFVMVKRRYQLKQEQDSFLSPERP